jgi:chromosome partitioning protein
MEATKKCQIIAFHLTKGGVGKTTTLINFGHCLMNKGYKILFVDCDPQSSLTRFYGIYKKVDSRISDLLTKSDKIQPFSITPKLNFIAGDKTSYNISVPVNRLKERLEMYRNDFDFILIDTSPAISTITLNAMSACDYIFLPVESSRAGLEAIEDTLEAYDTNQTNKIGGLFMTKYKKGGVSSEQIKIALEGKIMKSYVRDSAHAQNSHLEGQAVVENGNTPLSHDYETLTDEILEIIKE